MKVNDFGEYEDDQPAFDPYADPNAPKPQKSTPDPQTTPVTMAGGSGPKIDYPDQPVKMPDQAGAAPGGYDYGKFQAGWLGATPGTSLDQFIKDHPDYMTGVTSSNNGEWANLPGGEAFDAVGDFGPGGKNKPQFGSKDYNYQTGAKYSPQEAAAAEAKWASENPSSGAGGAPPSSGSGGGSQDDDVMSWIRRLLGRGEAPVSADDPAIKAQFDPIKGVMERGGQMARGAAAERQAFNGTNVAGGGGALDAEVNSINEGTQSKEGELMAGLVGDELKGRRADVANAINFAQGEEKMNLQRELAAIDAEIRKQAMSNQNTQFYDNQAYNIGRDEYMFNQNYDNNLGVGS